MRARLTKLSDNPNALRTNSVIGVFERWPTVGFKFAVWNDEPLDASQDLRFVSTNPVVEIVEQKHAEDGAMTMDFKTENSLYRLEEL